MDATPQEATARAILPLEQNSGKDGAVKEGLACNPWSADEDEAPSRLIRRQNASSPTVLVEEGGVGTHGTVEGSALLSCKRANTVVLQSLQLVLVVPDQLLDDLVRQVAWGRVDR